MSGWIKIYREITQHWIFQDAEKFKWWIDMIFLASYEDNRVLVGNHLVSLKRGQFIASIAFLVKRWGVGKDKVINFLKLLQVDGMIAPCFGVRFRTGPKVFSLCIKPPANMIVTVNYFSVEFHTHPPGSQPFPHRSERAPAHPESDGDILQHRLSRLPD